MAYDFSSFKKRLSEIEEWLSKEYVGIHTGRATVQVLDSIMVENYGVKTQIPHMASISIEGPRVLRIIPWDKGAIKSIEKAIMNSSVGLSVSADSEGLRANFPALSDERRLQVLKVVRGKLEEARVSIRKDRDAIWNDIQEQTKSGEMTEDDKFLFKEQLQKIVDDTTNSLEDMAGRKEKEIQS